MQAARKEKGAMLVEFALVLPLLLLLLLGFLQFGLAMNAKIDSTHLTAMGARYVVVNQNPAADGATLQDYIRDRVNTSYLETASICVSYPLNAETGTAGKVGDPVKVEILPVSIDPFVGTLNGLTLPSPSVGGETTMRLETLPTKFSAGCA